MDASERKPTSQYDAFICYSRQDKVFAALLEKALESYKPTKHLSVPQRHLRIFRDEQDFTGPDYYAALSTHLGTTAKLIVVCSPAARQSQFVDDEIRRFVTAKGANQLVPTLPSGIPNNEAKPGQPPCALPRRIESSQRCRSLSMKSTVS